MAAPHPHTFFTLSSHFPHSSLTLWAVDGPVRHPHDARAGHGRKHPAGGGTPHGPVVSLRGGLATEQRMKTTGSVACLKTAEGLPAQRLCKPAPYLHVPDWPRSAFRTAWAAGRVSHSTCFTDGPSPCCIQTSPTCRYTSCADLFNSRFNPIDYEPLGISGVTVIGVTR